jgi:mannose-6-phosphate isomerase
MTIEHAGIRVVDKPWGSPDLRPWSEIQHDGAAIGELWFQHADEGGSAPALLLKLLFTRKPLSIQVHPDDGFAQSIGLANGKSEAWYVLSAAPGARIALGLKRQLTAAQLRVSIEDGSIAELVAWRAVTQGDVVFVPAGAIHSIGAGLVIAEIQQRSDATFRLFDYGRARELHVENSVAAAHAGPAERQSATKRLSDFRTLLVASPHFVFERIDLPAKSRWRIHAERETWVLILEGHARIGPMNAFIGETIFLENDDASVKVGPSGLKGLIAYVGSKPDPDLLEAFDGVGVSARDPVPVSLHPARLAKSSARSSEAPI